MPVGVLDPELPTVQRSWTGARDVTAEVDEEAAGQEATHRLNAGAPVRAADRAGQAEAILISFAARRVYRGTNMRR